MFEYKLLILIVMLGDVARRFFAEVNGGGHVRGERGEERFSRGHRTKFAWGTTSLWRVVMVYNALPDQSEVVTESESYVRRKRRYMVLYEKEPVSMDSWELRFNR
jgi:hypothetical protein